VEHFRTARVPAHGHRARPSGRPLSNYGGEDVGMTHTRGEARMTLTRAVTNYFTLWDRCGGSEAIAADLFAEARQNMRDVLAAQADQLGAPSDRQLSSDLLDDELPRNSRE